MIFSKFFKPAWQHKDSNIRINAINNELDVSNGEHHKVLLSLLDNDDSELVRRAVLIRLNEFEQWLRAQTENSNKKIREYAQQQIETIIVDNHAIKLGVDQKLVLIDKLQCSVLESWLKQENDANLVVALFRKINKPQLLVSTFSHHQNTSVQLALLEFAESKEILEKLLRKCADDLVRKEIQNKLALLKDQQEKPLKVAKQAQLVLSKYLALKDISNYQEFIDKKEVLQGQWAELFVQFECLAPDDVAILNDKMANIERQITTIFAQKAEQYEQQKIETQLSIRKREDEDKIQRELANLESLLTNSIFENNGIDDKQFSENVAQLQSFISHSAVDDSTQTSYQHQLTIILNKLSKLPEIANSVTQATHLISKISQLALPTNVEQLNEKQNIYNEWLNQWQEISKNSCGVLPDSIVSAYNEITQAWKKALKPLHAKQNKSFEHVKRTLNDINRLIASGKFNAAFGVFKKATKTFEQLSSHQQLKLQRLFQSVQDKIADISDWEHYVSTPKKNELLVKIQTLVESPLDNPKEQAAQVKTLRSQWNQLGHAEDAVEQTLNEQFNVACEKAFAPCRMYFAEQEKFREQRLVVRNALIEQVSEFEKQFDEKNADWKVIDKKVHSFLRQWKEAGEVERSVYQQLNDQFNQLLSPIKNAVSNYHQENVKSKKQLIEQANDALALDDIDESVAKTKQLQSRWRDIGYCGARDENKLWKSFRAINDQVFERRVQQQSAQHKIQNAKIESYLSELVAIEDRLSSTSEEALIISLSNELKIMADNIQGESVKLTPVEKKLSIIEKSLAQQLTIIEKNKTIENWHTIFNVLAASINKKMDDIEAFSTLSTKWQDKLINLAFNNDVNGERLEKTIMMEIVSGTPSTEEDKQQRLTIQVAMMQNQLATGTEAKLTDVFDQWLNIGAMTPADKPLLERVKNLFIANSL